MPSPRLTTPRVFFLGLVISATQPSCSRSSSKQTKVSPTPAPAPAPRTPSTKKSKGEEHVKTALIPLDSDQDGVWDLLAVDWSITPGWHIYWTNPGDSGLASEVELDPKSTLAFTKVQLPAPSKFFSAGDLVGYGYHDQTTFFAKRKAPKAAIAAPIQAKLTWLVCKTSCLRGSTQIRLDPSAKPVPWSEAQRKAYARLPKPPQDLPATSTWSAPPSQKLTLKAGKGQIVEFFPLETKAQLNNSTLREGELELSYQNPNALAASSSAQGVIGIRTGQATTYYELQTLAP